MEGADCKSRKVRVSETTRQADTSINSFKSQRPLENLSDYQQRFKMRPDGPRDSIVGPDNGPEPPFPLKLNGEVVKGFGRGSKEVSGPPSRIITTTTLLDSFDSIHCTINRMDIRKG